jgi:putative protease
MAKQNKEPARNATAVAGGGKLIGKVTHYFSNIGVAVIGLSTSLGQGDEIRIVGGENTDFNQKVDSMQVDHKEVKNAKKGDSVGLKMSQKVREGYLVYKP